MNESSEPKREDHSAAGTLEAAIAKHSFLAGVKPAHLRVLFQNAMRVHFKEGETIFREGDPANRFYLIETGKVSLETHVKEGPGHPVQTITAGDVLGWSWLFPPYYLHLSARALEPTRTIFFHGTRLREQCEQDHDLGYQLMKRIAEVVIQRLRATQQRLMECNDTSKLSNS